MRILRIGGDHPPSFLRQGNLVLPSPATIGDNEIILLSETVQSPAVEREPIRFAMRARLLGVDDSVEFAILAGRHLRYTQETHALWALATPFRMMAVQVTGTDYEAGGHLMLVAPEDETLIRSRALLRSKAEAEPVALTPEQAELSAAFVSLWDKAVGKSEYEKREWTAFRGLLLARGVMRG